MRPAAVESELRPKLGDEAYLKFVTVFGGRSIHIPKRIKGSHLESVIGTERAQIVSDLYAPDVLVVPLSKKFRAKYFYSQGRSVSEIASMLCMTRQGVQRLLGTVRKGSNSRRVKPIPRSSG